MKKNSEIVSMSLCFLAMLFSTASFAAESIKAYTAVLPPYTLGSGLDEPGIAHELLVEMSKRSGVPVEIEYVPWKRAQLTVQKTPNTMLFSAGRTKAREDLYNWITLMAEPNEVFVSLDKKINSYEEAKALSNIVVLKNTPRDKKLAANGVSKLQQVRDSSLAAKVLNGKRADVWYTYDQRAAYVFKSQGFDPSKLVYGETLAVAKNWLASNKTFDQAKADKLKEALETIRADGTYQKIVEKYTK